MVAAGYAGGSRKADGLDWPIIFLALETILNLAYPSVSMGPHVSLQKNGNQCGLFKSWTDFKVAAPSSENERIHSVLN